MTFRPSLLLMWLALGIAGGSLMFGFIQAGVGYLALIVSMFIVLGMAGEFYRWSWLPSLMLFGLALLSLIGLWMDLWPGWSLLGLLGAITFSDVAHFRMRIARAMQVGLDADRMEVRHLKRLGFVLGLGAILYIIPWFTQVQLNFGIAVVLGLIAVIGISLGINKRGQSSN